MLVVSDTTPLISLLKINQIDLLRRLFGEVVIPYAVYEELTVDKRFEEEAECIKNKNFIIIKDVESQESVDILRKVSGLDKGESEATSYESGYYSHPWAAAEQSEECLFGHTQRKNRGVYRGLRFREIQHRV